MATSTNKPGARAPAPGISDGSVSQAFLRACEQVAAEVADRFFTTSKAGATVSGGVVTVEIRARETRFQMADLSASGVFTVDNTTEDMRNYWSNMIPQTIVGCWGNVRVETEAPELDPASDVEPE